MDWRGGGGARRGGEVRGKQDRGRGEQDRGRRGWGPWVETWELARRREV